MKANQLKAIVAFLLMLSAFVGAQAWRPTSRLADTRAKVELDSLFPKAFDDWQLDEHMPVQLISPDAQAVLNKIYNQTLSRTYINGKGERVMLSVAYGGDQSDATRAHRPEVCYPAQGFEVVYSYDTALNIDAQWLRVRELVTKHNARTEPITYWITVGEHATISGTEQKLAQLTYSTRGLIPDGMLVRVSNISNDIPGSYKIHLEFIEKMARHIPVDQRSIVFGKPGIM
jgi:EpsI family protein